jgi:hypothetical protein
MRVVGALPPAIVDALLVFERAATLEDVLPWAHARGGELVDVIIQDEFTHDVIVRAGPSAFLVFDTT